MRRAIPVLLATAGGAVLLASFHTSPSVTNLASADSSTLPTAGVTTSTTSARTAPPPPVPNTARRIVVTTTASTVAPTRYFDGGTAQTQFGPVQVRIAIRGRQLLDVQPLQMPYAHERSAEISQQAGPILRNEALQAQSANIDIVSGASYTSVAYRESLQSALNLANA